MMMLRIGLRTGFQLCEQPLCTVVGASLFAYAGAKLLAPIAESTTQVHDAQPLARFVKLPLFCAMISLLLSPLPWFLLVRRFHPIMFLSVVRLFGHWCPIEGYRSLRILKLLQMLGRRSNAFAHRIGSCWLLHHPLRKPHIRHILIRGLGADRAAADHRLAQPIEPGTLLYRIDVPDAAGFVAGDAGR